MPLVIEHVETGEQFHDTKNEKAHDHNVRVNRRVFCTGCGTGATYKPEQWTFYPDQVQSWFEEHKGHKVTK